MGPSQKIARRHRSWLFTRAIGGVVFAVILAGGCDNGHDGSESKRAKPAPRSVAVDGRAAEAAKPNDGDAAHTVGAPTQVEPHASAEAPAKATAEPGENSAGGAARADRPPPPTGEMAICLKLIETKRYSEARSRLEPILRVYDDWPRANLLYAVAFHKDGRYGEARPYFEKVLRLDPSQTATLPFLGWCLYYLGDLAESRSRFEAYLRDVNPDYADAHYALGLIAYDLDEIDAARARFERTIELAVAERDARTEGKARTRLADVMIRLGDLPGAKAELKKAIAVRPDAYAAWFKLSRVLQRMGDTEGAAHARQMHEQVRERVRPSGRTQTMGPQRYDEPD